MKAVCKLCEGDAVQFTAKGFGICEECREDIARAKEPPLEPLWYFQDRAEAKDAFTFEQAEVIEQWVRANFERRK